MTSAQLNEHVRRLASAVSFGWTAAKPELLQTLHQHIVSSIPATSQVVVPIDAPIFDVTLGTSILPSQLQNLLLDEIVPSLLVAVQAVVEDGLSGEGFKSQIEFLVGSGKVSRAQASECHHWRFVRNAIAHSAERHRSATR